MFLWSVGQFMNRANNRAAQRVTSPVRKRSILLSGHKTSVSREEPFWQVLHEIAQARGGSVSGLISSIDRKRVDGNLSSALRLFVLEHVRTAGREGAEP
jgi:predicted DNA-binding ribbon-helix-helix protein